MTTAGESVLAQLAELQRRLLAVGLFFLAVCVLAALFAPEQFFRSYLLAYLLWLSVALGSLALLLMHHLTGGAWGLVVRRVLESTVRTMPLLLALFVPVLLGLPHLYVWAIPEAVAADPALLAKQGYLNRGFFLGRAAVYFAIWIALAQLLLRWSADAERGDALSARRLPRLAAGGLLLYGLTVTFASIDWVMSIEPHWYSTVYGLLFMVGQTLTALAFAIPVLLWLARRPPLDAVVSRDHCHDLGNLLLAFVLIWAYLGFSQYLITWSGNLPEEIPWYLARTRGGWEAIGLILIVLHFAIPFSLLLLRVTKRTRSGLAAVALLILALRLVDLFWMVRPPFAAELRIHWLDPAVTIGLGGVWLAVFTRALRSRSLEPVGALAASLSGRTA